MALVSHIVRETMGRVPAHVSRDDLTSAGLTALVKAAQAYEAERGVPFTRYAASRIRGAILDELRGIDWASRSVRRRGRDLEAARSSLAAELGRAPEVHEVAARAGMSVADVENNDGDVARANVLSLQGSEVSFEEVLVSSTPEPGQLVEHRERLEYLVDAIAELPERMRVVVQEYFLAERPMAEIAETLGVTESRISQIRAEALVLLRDALNSALDPDLVAAHPRPQGCAAQRRSAYFAAVAARHATGRTQGRTAVAGIA
ncbi:sigma-70 family RNA polymerase sigma factor [Nocardioides sp. GY 10127]|nr:sigma-70 family RNA polymerase sigma factor [Nocardioides sp. GY 10127]